MYPLNEKRGRIIINCHCIFSSIPVPAKKGKENEDPVSCSHLVLLSCIFTIVRMKHPLILMILILFHFIILISFNLCYIDKSFL